MLFDHTGSLRQLVRLVNFLERFQGYRLVASVFLDGAFLSDEDLSIEVLVAGFGVSAACRWYRYDRRFLERWSNRLWCDLFWHRMRNQRDTMDLVQNLWKKYIHAPTVSVGLECPLNWIVRTVRSEGAGLLYA